MDSICSLFRACALACVCVFAALLREAPVQLSGLACRWPSRGPAEGEIRCRLSFLLFSSPLLSHILTSFFSLPFFSTPPPAPSFSPPGFIYQLHPRLPPFLSSLHLLRAILVAEENFFRSLFSSLPLRSVFMCLSGLRAPAIHGGFGMKCLLTEPCAPELR